MKTRYLIFLTVLISFLFSDTISFSQNDTIKKQYTKELDSLWSTDTFIQKLSKDGNWILFEENNISSGKKHFLKSTIKTTTIEIYKPIFNAFSPDSKWFAYLSTHGSLIIIDLSSQNVLSYNHISSFEFNFLGTKIVAIAYDNNNKKSLQIINLIDSTMTQLDDFSEFFINPNHNKGFGIRRNKTISQLVLLDFNQKPVIEILKTIKNYNLSEVVWNETGNSVVMLEEIEGVYNLFYYQTEGNKSYIKPELWSNNFPYERISDKEIQISDDGKTIFFYREKTKKDPLQVEDIEIWNTHDHWIYPQLKRYNDNEGKYTLTLWRPKSSTLSTIGDEDTPTTKSNPNFKNALLFNRLFYHQAYTQYEYVDLYIKDLESGVKRLIVKNQYASNAYICFSPSGRYIAYFNESHWWVYDSKKQTTVNLTFDVETPFFDKDNLKKNNKEPYGIAGWTKNENALIVYDINDIWSVNIDGQEQRRLTKGKEEQATYRIGFHFDKNSKSFPLKNRNYIGITYDISSPILLEIAGENHQSGYAILKNNTVEKITYSHTQKVNLLLSEDSKTMVYKSLKINEPPSIHCIKLPTKHNNLLYQSNKELLTYDLGKYELVHYESTNGDILKGALIYPSQFNSYKKYPMIVNIYEKNSKSINQFSPPSDFAADGFNILRYITNGYFVFLPDIEYEVGSPAESALNCVMTGVQNVIVNYPINPKKIGLIGFSFGGYEASYIATKTNIFQCVVAGAAVADLTSWYHDVSWGWETNQAWRMESQQFHMGASYYDLKDQYYFNSPLHQIESLVTPILLWTGKNDFNINWNQSIYMHMAMKRLNKEGKLLLFNNESHALDKLENQKRLSKEIFTWFELYLK